MGARERARADRRGEMVGCAAGIMHTYVFHSLDFSLSLSLSPSRSNEVFSDAVAAAEQREKNDRF